MQRYKAEREGKILEGGAKRFSNQEGSDTNPTATA